MNAPAEKVDVPRRTGDDHASLAGGAGKALVNDRLLAHLGHVEMATVDLEAAVAFHRDVLGLQESGRDGRSVFLRGWGEWDFHSLQLTEAAATEMVHLGWRALSAEHLARAVQRLERAGAGIGWLDASTGHGPAFRFRSPGGQLHEVYWEVERYVAPPELRSPVPNRPQRVVARGIAPRQIDHVTVMTADPLHDAGWYRDVLGFTFTEWTVLDDAEVPVFATVTNTEKSHDLGLVIDQSDAVGRMHHLAWWVDSREDLLRAAEILVDAGVEIEHGPGRHGIGEQDYLYFRGPGGARIEIVTGGYRLYEPDWQPVKWTPSQGANSLYRNVAMPTSMLDGIPAVAPDPQRTMVNPWSSEVVR